METMEQYSAYPDSYIGTEGCLSILRQNIISAEQTEFPFRFRINLFWTPEEIEQAISRIQDYRVDFNSDENVFTISRME